MKVRTFILTAGAIVALAAPTVAGARTLPIKHKTKVVHVAKPTVKKRQGQPLQRYIYVSIPAESVAPAADSSQPADTSADSTTTTTSDDDCDG